MAAAVLALVALLQASPADDGPVSTAPRVPVIRPAQAAALPSASATMTAARAAAQPPADDYGYVAWCYGALDTYLNLYDRVMPEVTRIERAFPGPRGAEADLRLYPQMRDQAQRDLLSYRVAITAAERASPRTIGAEGAIALRRGRAVWSGAAQATTAQVAREWMGWTPPARCNEVAKTLAVRSTVLGQALNANQEAPTSALAAFEAEVAATAPEPAAPPPEPIPVAVAVAKPAPKPVLKPAVAVAPKPAAKPAAPKVAAGPAPVLPIGAFIIDPDNPRGCPGKIDATIKDGRIVMVCVP